VVVGAFAAFAALTTLSTIRKQVRLANRPYLELKNWRLDTSLLTEPGGPPNIQVFFEIANLSHAPARLAKMDIEYGLSGREVISAMWPIGALLSPNHSHPMSISDIGPLNSEEYQKYKAAGLVLNISGCIVYTDQFKKTRHRRFAVGCGVNYGLRKVDWPGWTNRNDEDEWGED